MDGNAETDISEYDQIPLASLALPDHYNKLIKRIKNSAAEGLNIETVGDILKLEPYQFSNFKGIGNHYVKTLVEFKKELPHFLIRLKKEPNSFIEEDIFTSPENNYDFETPINQLDLSPKYQKLIKRISAVIDQVETIQDILDINVADFSKLRGVGKLYVELLMHLQTELSLAKTDQIHNEKKPVIIELPNQNILSKLYVNYGFLTEIEAKQLKKLGKFYNGQIDIRNVNVLLGLGIADLARKSGFGVIFLKTIKDLQEKIKRELVALPENIVDYTIKERGLFISSEIAFIEFYEIDNTLIEDIEGYLWTLDEMKTDVAQSRWGFNQQHETLEEVGSRYSLTRERIRQFEKYINTNLILNFRIQPKVLWANIREKMTNDLTALLPNLAKCFATDKLFYEFIEICCQVESGSILEIMMPKINNNILNHIFCSNPSPIAKEIIINELLSNYGYSKAAAIHGIKQLEKINKIEITEQGILPKKLSKIEAVAHTLTFHPAGLPWKDISRIANKKGYSSTPFDETRLMPSAFSDSEYVYLCDKGTYRNLMFLDLGQFDIPKIMQNLLDYLKQRQIKALHLHDYYYQSKDSRSEIEYFTLRHLVRGYGEEYGLYFNGQSGSDSVSLDPDLKRITQADVIIKVLNESKAALTKQEIAERLRSKSINHAAFYIANLMEENKIVRVDQLVYTTPEKAFKDLDTKAIMQVIKDIMNISDIIVEADVFREYVNMELNLSYSKYIYAALVKTQIKELDWYRNGNLFSKKTIPYNSLIDMCKKLCNPELSNSLNVKIIQKAVWLTDAVATVAINQWKRQME
ncbi:hypothetical protein [Nitrosomonas sp.]|uniref:hypothetical protein n=1 Tax=Nitrosomonas sp. TaxID=42353 RepID=UPI00273766E8|nr:hypothetical protein [Nitrosomonas sp.]